MSRFQYTIYDMPFRSTVEGISAEILEAKDGDLFLLMTDQGNPGRARAAWNEFYRRYSTYLWNSCLYVCRSVPEGDRLAKDIFQSTMHKVFSRAATFDPAKGLGIKPWISRIAHNEFIDYFNKYNSRFVPGALEIEIEDEAFDEETDSDTLNKVLVIQLEQLRVLLQQLTAKELKILMTYMNYYQIDNPNSHLPDEEMSRLCDEYKIKSDAVRQIKRRALIKLRTLVKR